MINKILLQYFSGAIFSIIGLESFFVLFEKLEKVNLYFWGDMTRPLISLLLGPMLGGIFGIVFIEKVVYKVQGWKALGIAVAIIFSFLGPFFGLVLMDEFGGGLYWLTPFVTTFMCVAGYNIPIIFKIRSSAGF